MNVTNAKFIAAAANVLEGVIDDVALTRQDAPLLAINDNGVEVMDIFDGLKNAQILCHGLAQKSGWWIDTETGEDVRTWPKKFLNLWIASKLMLVVTEAAEAMEGHRKDLPDDKLPHRRMLEVELADALIRIFDLAGGLGFDIAGAVVEKLAFNQQRADHKLENRTAAGGKSI